MAVTQISRIQVRRGSKDALPQRLEEGEFGFAVDTGELFIGAPNLPKIEHRNSTYPYNNVRVLTEFDVVHTFHDHVVTTTPLFRVSSMSRLVTPPTTPIGIVDGVIYDFTYTGETAPVDSIVYLDPSNPNNPGDLRGRVITGAKIIYNNGNNGDLVTRAFTVVHTNGLTTPNSRIMLDLDELNMQSYPAGATWRLTFLPLDTVARWSLAESDSYVMQYSMTSNETVNGLKVRRVGQLYIAADDYSVQLVDTGVDMNQDPDNNNYMRIIFSGHIETNEDGEKTVVLTCTNTSYHDISITFAGNRWAHTTLED